MQSATTTQEATTRVSPTTVPHKSADGRVAENAPAPS
jgi:hypothetical protein